MCALYVNCRQKLEFRVDLAMTRIQWKSSEIRLKTETKTMSLLMVQVTTRLDVLMFRVSNNWLYKIMFRYLQALSNASKSFESDQNAYKLIVQEAKKKNLQNCHVIPSFWYNRHVHWMVWCDFVNVLTPFEACKSTTIRIWFFYF